MSIHDSVSAGIYLPRMEGGGYYFGKVGSLPTAGEPNMPLSSVMIRDDLQPGLEGKAGVELRGDGC